jgi:hypothetical protein
LRIHCLLFASVYLLGCSGGPSRVEPPDVDPEAAAAEALELYDTDNNGTLNETELAGCPGMLAARGAYDADTSGEITAEEIAERLEALHKYGVGLTRLQCEVRLNGRPLAGAEVEFEPEAYLGDEMLPAYGTTNDRGLAQMAIPAESLPSEQQRLKAIQYGTYKVRITHPQTALPARYNAETTLGYETRAGDPFASFSLRAP